nr:MAG TPA: hypothetical protein [Caudoviricetes sp.]
MVMSTITEQISAVTNGGTVKMGQDESAEVVIENGRTFTLDLGGFTLTAPAGKTPLLVKNGDVTVTNGTIVAVDQPCIRVGVKDATEASKVTLNSDLKLDNTDYCAVFIAKNATLITSADIVTRFSKGSEGVSSIQGNDTSPYFGNRCVVKGGDISVVNPEGKETPAIYWPQEGDLVIEGGNITGDTGIEIRAGTLTITGGFINSSASAYSVKANGNGATTIGAAVAVAQHTTRLPIAVNISGGAFTGPLGLSESNPQGNPLATVSQVSMAVSGGVFNSDDCIRSQDCKGFITGGVFSRPLDTLYLSPGTRLVTNGDGTYSYWAPIDGGECNALAEFKSDGIISSLQQGTLIGAVNELPKTGMKKNQVLYSITDRRIYRYDGTAWAVEDPDVADKALDSTSTRPVANKVVAEMKAELDSDIANRYTKAEVDQQMDTKAETINGSAKYAAYHDLPANYVVVTDESGQMKTSEKIDVGLINRLSGVQFNVQEQINALDRKVEDRVTTETFNSRKTDVDNALSLRYTKSETNAKLAKKQNKLVAGTNITIGDDSTISANFQLAVDDALSSTSLNPVQNKVVTTKFDKVDSELKLKATKTELTNGLAGKAPAGDYVVQTNLTETLKGYATKSDLSAAVTQVYQFKGTCTSAELDDKPEVVGTIWNLTDSRVGSDGKTYKAGTSWVYEYIDSSNKGWEPMGANFDIDLSQLQGKNVTFEGTVQTWAEASDCPGFTRKGTITKAGIKNTDIATVVFNAADATSGKLAPVCATDTDKVYVWATKDIADLRALVVVQKG